MHPKFGCPFADFPVHSLFIYDTLSSHVNPFLLLAYAGPAQFEPAETPR